MAEVSVILALFYTSMACLTHKSLGERQRDFFDTEIFKCYKENGGDSKSGGSSKFYTFHEG